jgi:hypothetical protein
MANLTIATGLKEYSLTDENGNVKVTLYFNPTDPVFIEGLYNAFSTLDKKDEEYRERVQKETDGAVLFDLARTMDAEMRNLIDTALGTEVCQPLFGNINVYARADGLPLWANLLLAIIEEMDDAFAKEKKAEDPRIKKYTSKFKKAG